MSCNLLIMERTFAAPPAKVFAFITERDNLLKWWGPSGTSVAENNLDLSGLGEYWFIMIDPTGGRTKVSGEVLKVNPPHLVEFSLIVHMPDGPPMIDSVVRFEVAAMDTGGTHFMKKSKCRVNTAGPQPWHGLKNYYYNQQTE